MGGKGRLRQNVDWEARLRSQNLDVKDETLKVLRYLF